MVPTGYCAIRPLRLDSSHMGCLPYFRKVNDRAFSLKDSRHDLEFWKLVLLIVYHPFTRFSKFRETGRRQALSPARGFASGDDPGSGGTDELVPCTKEGRMLVGCLVPDRRRQTRKVRATDTPDQR